MRNSPEADDGVNSKLTLVATPIGNLGDLSVRTIQELKQADVWFVEDTRISGKLGSHLGIKKPMRVLNEHSSQHIVERYAAEIASGKKAVILTDGGAPVVSDPGTQLTEECYELGIEVDAIPGPSAVINALMLSGFFAQRFAFLGFLGRKPGAIKGELEPYADSPFTLVLFESPHRVDALLRLAHEVLGERRYAICREMTKAHQQVVRDKLPSVPDDSTMLRRGEFTVVIEGRRRGELSE